MKCQDTLLLGKWNLGKFFLFQHHWTISIQHHCHSSCHLFLTTFPDSFSISQWRNLGSLQGQSKWESPHCSWQRECGFVLVGFFPGKFIRRQSMGNLARVVTNCLVSRVHYLHLSLHAHEYIWKDDPRSQGLPSFYLEFWECDYSFL